MSVCQSLKTPKQKAINPQSFHLTTTNLNITLTNIFTTTLTSYYYTNFQYFPPFIAQLFSFLACFEIPKFYNQNVLGNCP